MDDKQITLKISGRVYKDLRSAMGIRMLADAGGGLADAFINKILEAIEDQEFEVEVKYKPREALTKH